MVHRLAADGLLIAHAGFVIFVGCGGLLVWYRRWWAALHLPAIAWGLFIELSGTPCPLTAIEHSLRIAAGQAGYEQSFITHWLTAIIYPAGLTRDWQFLLACITLVANLVVYGLLIYRERSSIGA